MSEQQKTTDFVYTSEDGTEFNVSLPGELSQEEVLEWASTYGEETEIAAGIREPGFGPLTMGLVPTEAIERGLYGARQVGATLGTELGLLDEDTAAEDIAKMERYKQYSREQARREDFASGELVTDPETGRLVREGQLEYEADQETLRKLSEAETFSDAMSTLASNPGAVLPIIGESLGLFAPALAGTVAVGVATGGAGVPGIIATALTAGLGSGATEYGASFLQAFSENGVDVTDDEQVIAALNNDEQLSDIREDAAKRGIAIGAFDAATVGFAGKLTSLIKGAPLSKAATEASKLRRVGAGTAEAAAQAVGGGGGEAAAQALTGEYKPGEILLEAVAEVPTALPEVALGARATRARKLRRALEERGYSDDQINEFGSMSGNEQNKIIKELNAANVSTTFPSQREVEIQQQQEEVQQRQEDIKVEEAAEASEFAQTTMLEDLYADTIEEVDTAAPITTEELTVTQPQAQDLFSDSESAVGQTPRSLDTYSSIRVEMTPAKFLENVEPLGYDPRTESGPKSETMKFVTREANKFKQGKDHQKMGIPFMTLQWDNKIKKWNPKLSNHEGRHRVLGVENIFGSNAKVPVNVALRNENGKDIPVGALTGERELGIVKSEEQAAEMREALEEWRLGAEETPVTAAEEKQVKETSVDNFVEQPISEQETALAQEGTTTDLKQNEEFINTLKQQASAAGVSEENITRAADERANKIVQAAEEQDYTASDPDSMAGRTPDGRLIRSEEEAIQFTGDQLAESNGRVGPVLAAKPLSQGEYNDFAARTAKDLNFFARWWNFPDVMAERYPVFAPYWNAVNLQRQIAAFKITDYMTPMANPLKALKTDESQKGVAQALELLDQMRRDANKFTTNGKLDPAQMVDPTNSSQYILKNEGGDDVNTALTKDGDTIVLDQTQMDALLAIRESFDKAKSDIIAAYNTNFYFGRETTPQNLQALVNRLKSFTNQADKTQISGNITVSADNQQALMQAIKDSPLINTSDPKSIFNTETDPAKLINYINNYRNTLAVYAANPFYFPHQRLGSVAFIVTEVIDGKSENVWVETHAPKEFKKNLLTADFNEIKNTKKYKQIMARLRQEYSGSRYTIKPPVNFDKSFTEYTENVTPDNINELLSRVADIQMEGLTKEQNDAVTDFLSKARNLLLTEQGSSVDPAKMITRLNTRGWINDDNAIDQMNNTINIYLGKVAGYVANQNTKDLRAEAIRQLDTPSSGKAFPKLATYAKELEEYMNSGYRDALNLKRISFHYFLGLNPSSAVVNLTQIPMATVPWLIRYTSSTSAQLEIMRAMKDAGKIAGLIKGLKRTGTGTVTEILQLDNPLGKSNEARQLWNDMKIDLQNSRLISQVTAEQAGLINYGQFQAGKSVIRNIENFSSSIFSYVELINRMSTYIAAHRTYTKAQKKGKLEDITRILNKNSDYRAMDQMPDYTGSSEARKFAAFSVDKTQFLMGADNRPMFMRGTIPSIIFQFMQFPVRYLQLIDGLVFREGGVVKNPKERAAALAYMAAFMIMTGGFWSLPLAENAVDLGEFVYKGLYKTDPMIKAELDKALFRMGMEDPSYFTRGVIPQLANISLTSRTGAGRLIQPDMFSGDFSKTIGPAGSMIFGSAAAAIQAIHNDNYMMAFANLAPTSAYNAVKAIKMGTTGQVKTSRENRVMLADEISARQVLPQILGFQPEDISQQMLFEFNMRRRNTRVSELQVSFGNKIKSNLADAYRNQILYDKSVAKNRPEPALLEAAKESYKEASKYMEQMRVYNEETEDPSLRLNFSGATFRSWSKNAAERARGMPKLGRKVARQTELQDRYEMAPYPQKLKMIRDGFIPHRP